VTDLVGGQGQNRTADTRIFSWFRAISANNPQL